MPDIAGEAKLDKLLREVWIFANPISGRGRGLEIARRLSTRLDADGFQPRLFFDRADQIPDGEFSVPARAAIVIGGDGTLRTVADRLVGRGGGTALIPLPPILPIGLGTANLMVRHLGLHWEDATLDADVSEAIRSMNVRALDVARANGKLFLLMAGIGFDAHIVHELDRLRTGPIGWLNYLHPAALALQGYAFHPIEVTVDGRPVWPSAPGLAFVGNIREYGTGFPVLPMARPDDELLDVCVLPCRAVTDLVQLFVVAAAGQHVTQDGAIYVRGRQVRISAATPVPVQIDGDPGGFTPVEIQVLSFRMDFIVRPGQWSPQPFGISNLRSQISEIVMKIIEKARP